MQIVKFVVLSERNFRDMIVEAFADMLEGRAEREELIKNGGWAMSVGFMGKLFGKDALSLDAILAEDKKTGILDIIGDSLRDRHVPECKGIYIMSDEGELKEWWIFEDSKGELCDELFPEDKEKPFCCA